MTVSLVRCFMLFLLTGYLLIWRISAENARPLVRHKRILNGYEAKDRNSGYAVARYSIWMSHQTFCSSIFFNKWDSDLYTVMCDVDHTKLRCGGALIAINIVQTACHCIADKAPVGEKGKPSRYLRIEPFERRFYVFAGWTTVADFKIGYGAVQYVMNEQCANLNLRNNSVDNGAFPLVYDYGLIILRTAVAPYRGFDRDETNYAPFYMIRDLERIWMRVLSHELVCLFAGYGLGTSGSAELRHGWGIMRNYLKCMWLVDLPLKTKYFDYKKDATWYCSSSLPEHSDRVISGDSGSPVTCENEYVGVVSYTAAHPETNERVVLTAPLIYSLLENAAEYRNSLLELGKYPPEELSTITRQPLTLRPSTAGEDFALKSISHTHIPSLAIVCAAVAFQNMV